MFLRGQVPPFQKRCDDGHLPEPALDESGVGPVQISEEDGVKDPLSYYWRDRCLHSFLRFSRFWTNLLPDPLLSVDVIQFLTMRIWILFENDLGRQNVEADGLVVLFQHQQGKAEGLLTL